MPTDISITPTNITSEFRVATRIAPTYLVSLESEALRRGAKENFVAVKFDDTSTCYAKFVGFYSNETSDKITAEYKTLVENTDKTNFVEVMIPWDRVINIKSLVFQYKGNSK